MWRNILTGNVLLTKSEYLLSSAFFKRETSFFNKLSAEHLWKGVTSVSNAGKKRGRGKGAGKKVAKDLNRGQIIGYGSKNILWPGLNSPVIHGRDLLQQQKLPEDQEREKQINKIRDSMGQFKMLKVNSIDRGWSGSKIAGRSIGPPDAIGDDKFEGFDTKVLENKIVFIMKGNLGRKRRYSVLSVTGNGNGLAGFATAKAPDARSALRKSKNRAGQKLMKIDLCDGRTIYHDFYSAFGKTKIFVSKKPEDYGLVCHRAVTTICNVIGIKDLYAKIEGSTNLQHIVKAFFTGLLQQRTSQTIADEKKLHLVEIKEDQNEIHKLVASPSVCRKAEDIGRSEILDFSHYVLGNKIMLRKKKPPIFYHGSIGHNLYLKRKESFRNQDKVRLDLKVNS